MEVGHHFLEHVLPESDEAIQSNRAAAGAEPVPLLAALVCASAFDLALHDAFGVLHGVPTYETYNARLHERRPGPLPHAGAGYRRLVRRAVIPRSSWSVPGPRPIPAWHLVGGKDPIDPDDLTGAEPDDGYPGPAARLDSPRRPEVPQGQAPRRRLRLGLRPAAQGRPDRDRGRRRLADRRLQLHGPRARVCQRDPRPADRRAPAALRDAALRRAAVPLRPGGASDRRAQRLGAEAAVHGRERPRLAVRPAGPRAGLVGRGAQDLQDADRRAALASAGPRPTA